MPFARTYLSCAMTSRVGSALLAAGGVLLGAAGLGLGAAFLGSIATRGAGAAFAMGAALAAVGMATVIVAGASGECKHGGHGDSQQTGFDQGFHRIKRLML